MESPADLVASQDDYNKHVWHICLWPNQWNTCNVHLRWHNVELDDKGKSNVPDTTGVYSLVIQPGIAKHPGCSYLMYVGKAKDLRKRFGDYLSRERTKRPKVVRLLEMYRGHIRFFYSTVDIETLDNTEEELINAFIPPCNSRFKGEVRRVSGAFR